MAAAATAAAPPFYFCNVVTSKREPAGRQSVSDQEAGEGRKPAASWGGMEEGERDGRLRHQEQKVKKKNRLKLRMYTCVSWCVRTCVHICVLLSVAK